MIFGTDNCIIFCIFVLIFLRHMKCCLLVCNLLPHPAPPQSNKCEDIILLHNKATIIVNYPDPDNIIVN